MTSATGEPTCREIFSKLKNDYFNQNKIATIWLPLVKNLYQFPVQQQKKIKSVDY
jgi:hypothetical protein